MSRRTPLNTRQVVVAFVAAAVAVPLLLLLWSATTRLLNARSDLSVMAGLALLVLMLALVGLVVYLLLSRLLGGRGADDEGAEALAGRARPRSLFEGTESPLENIHEERRNETQRE